MQANNRKALEAICATEIITRAIVRMLASIRIQPNNRFTPTHMKPNLSSPRVSAQLVHSIQSRYKLDR